MTREKINELLHEQEAELPLRQIQPAADPDEAERRLRREWRQQRRERRERQQESEGSWDDWERWVSARIEAALKAERAVYERERKALVHGIESAVGEAVAQLLHSLRSDLCDRLDGFASKVTELEKLWRASSNASAAEAADLRDELVRLLKAINSIRGDLALAPISVSRSIAN
jgi:hypothetical protein